MRKHSEEQYSNQHLFLSTPIPIAATEKSRGSRLRSIRGWHRLVSFHDALLSTSLAIRQRKHKTHGIQGNEAGHHALPPKLTRVLLKRPQQAAAGSCVRGGSCAPGTMHRWGSTKTQSPRNARSKGIERRAGDYGSVIPQVTPFSLPLMTTDSCVHYRVVPYPPPRHRSRRTIRTLCASPRFPCPSGSIIHSIFMVQHHL